MQILKVEVEDSLYNKAIKNGMDIKEKFNEFLNFELKNDGYPAITTQEAKARVSKSVERYRSGKMETKPLDKSFWNDIEDRLVQRHKKSS